MDSMKFRYPAEKFAAARSILMLPHPEGEVQALASAFSECDLGLHDISDDMLDDSARHWVETVNRTMDTTGIAEDEITGTYYRKAETLTVEEIFEFSKSVDELACWFEMRFYSDS